MKTREEILLATKGAELIKIADKLGIKVNCNKERTQLKTSKGIVIKKILEVEKELEKKAKKEEKKVEKKATKKATEKVEKTPEQIAEAKAKRKAKRLETHALNMAATKELRESDAYTFNGKTQTLTEWSKELGILRKNLYRRIHYKGWTIERAFTTK